MAQEYERRQRAGAETREARAALGVEAVGRRVDQARVDRLEEEMGNLSLVVGGMEKEGADLVSAFFHGAVRGQHFFRQEGHAGILLIEQVELQKMQLKQAEREIENARKEGAKHRVANETFGKQVSIASSSGNRSSRSCNFRRFPPFMRHLS